VRRGFDVAAFFRLIGAGWRLARADALLPREIDPLLPPALRAAARTLRLFAGPQARLGRPGERLAGALERLGPAAIKLGQLLSTRADIFGEVFADDLSHLKDRLDAFPLAVAHAEIERSLGVSPEALFQRIDPPVAAASIAQAHPAILLDGRKVAVKVLRPGIERRIAQDAATLHMAAGLIDRFAAPARRLEPRALVATVIRSLELETDLRLEAGGASELRDVMNRDGFMTAPRVVWEGVGRRVLTLEWAHGVALSDPQSLVQPGVNRVETAIKLNRAFLSQALDHGVFHADLHEGNLFLAAPDQLTAVDFGIVGRITPRERLYLAQILWGFISRDYDLVSRAHFEAGYVPAHQSPELFAQALRAVGEPVAGRSANDVSMGPLLAQLFDITALFEMRLRPELVLLQKTMVTVEGVARRLNPAHDVWASAEPIVRRYISRELSPVATTKRHLSDALSALKAIARIAERQATLPVEVVEAPPKRSKGWLWLVSGVVLGAAIAAAWTLALT
jgi:ubiquinone biosynthesis protein